MQDNVTNCENVITPDEQEKETTVSTVGSDGTVSINFDEVAEQTEVTQEVQAEPTKEVQPEVAQEVQAEPAKEVQTEVTQEVQAEPAKEVQPEVTQEVQAEPAKEVQPEVTQETQPDPAEEAINAKISALASAIDSHFLIVRNLLSFCKEKDVNINKLNSELQAYRDGFEQRLFKPFALAFIGMLEDCKKSLREFIVRDLTAVEVKKFLNYIVYDFEDLLENLNVRIDGDKVLYNSVPVDVNLGEKIKLCEIEEFVLPEAPQLKNKDVDSIVEYLTETQTYITEILKANTALDKVLKTYIENATLYEKGVQQIVLYPIINETVKVYNQMKARVEEKISVLTDETAKAIFMDCENAVIENLRELLIKCGVTIDEYVSDKYDPLKHRLLKMVLTENQGENSLIVNRYTACYMLENKVIYPQKVDVYKYQQKI